MKSIKRNSSTLSGPCAASLCGAVEQARPQGVLREIDGRGAQAVRTGVGNKVVRTVGAGRGKGRDGGGMSLSCHFLPVTEDLHVLRRAESLRSSP